MTDKPDKEMQAALEADGEKLRQLTGEDHGPLQWPDWLKDVCASVDALTKEKDHG